MKTKFKMLTVVLIVAIVSSVFAIAVPTIAQETEEPSEDDVPICFGFRGRFRNRGMGLNGMAMPGLLNQFKEDATPTSVTGDIVALKRNILILETTDGVVQVVVPRVWMIDGEVDKLGTFIDEGLLIGEEVTVNALRADNEGVGYSIYVVFGYEIVYDDTTAYAVLPFNIEVP